MAHSRLHLSRLPVYGIHDGESILVCSPELAQIAGASSPEELIGRDPLSFIAPQARDNVAKAVMESRTGPYRAFENRLNGETYPIEINVQDIRFGSKRARMFTIRSLMPVAVVVDDEEPVANVTASLLKHVGYSTVVFHNPNDFIAE